MTRLSGSPGPLPIYPWIVLITAWLVPLPLAAPVELTTIHLTVAGWEAQKDNASEVERRGGAAGTGYPDYLQVVRGFIDALLEHGRDTYGPKRSPLLAAALDLKTLRLLDYEPRELPGLSRGERSLTGANPMQDMHLYQVMYALTKVTGEGRYASAADEILRWFFEHCQSPATALFAWGEHLGWDFRREAAIARRLPNWRRGPVLLPGEPVTEEVVGFHEFDCPWPLTERSMDLAPEAWRRFAHGLWRHQIADQTTGEYSREAEYHRHGPLKGHEYPRHGGFYIDVWSRAYQRWKDPEFVRAIDLLLTSFEKRCNPKTGALPTSSTELDSYSPFSTLSLAIDLWDSAARVPKELGNRMRAFAARIDSVFFRLRPDPARGYPEDASASTLVVRTVPPPHAARWRSVASTQPWGGGYGVFSDAAAALIFLERYRQGRDGRFRKLALATASRYLTLPPPEVRQLRQPYLHPAHISEILYPQPVADAIRLMLDVYRLTRDRHYLGRADDFARFGIDTFFADSPLPRASTHQDSYEAITGTDALVMELLELWIVKNRPGSQFDFVWVER